MYTLCSEHYKRNAIFRQDTFFLIDPACDSPCPWDDNRRHARIFHQCPGLRTRAGDNLGIIFVKERAENMKCDKCHKRPGDDITTIYTLMEGA
jgi:hypothetical protein